MKRAILCALLLLPVLACRADIDPETAPVTPSPEYPAVQATPTPAPMPEPTPEPISTPTPEPTPEPPQIPKTDGEIEALLEGMFSYCGLVDMESLNAGFYFNITYATENNFTGSILYDRPLCLALEETAVALLKAQMLADAEGYRLLIYDVYRPTEIQALMYELTPTKLRGFVAKPGPSAMHTKGVAVDCTLADTDGAPLPMPSEYDEFTKRASVAYEGGGAQERANRDLLISIMKSCGLKVASGEWWHFSLNGASGYPVLDVSFEEFEQARAKEQ